METFTSLGIRKILWLEQFIEESKDCLALGWGRKKSFFKAQAYAQQHGLEALCLEDGFIRSLGLGKEGYPPLSLVADRIGIYFDATAISELEVLISAEENTVVNERAQCAIHTMLEYGITKYNQKFTPVNHAQFIQHSKNILVVDQTYGDQSIKYSGADENTFQQMLQRACVDHPDATIWIKTHPDVIAGKAKAHFSQHQLNHPNIRLITENYNPIELLQQIDEVYVVSSQMGFEALLCNKKVHCFGVPWYAGWGLTNDIYAPLKLLKERRNQSKSVWHLFACAYFGYARYVNPITGQRCELEDILQLLIPNIEKQKHVQTSYIAYGFSPWKKQFISAFLGFPNLPLKFKRYLKPSKNECVLAWGKKARILKNQNYQNIITVEDGFIRSVGLGAKLIRPCSLVFDDIGIYYDATQPSRLENLLKNTVLTAAQRKRAQALIHSLINLNISKYNLGQGHKIERPKHHHVLLVVGQVEDDMSIQLGGVGIKTNLALLQRVRENNPQSFIIYKPHPDVQAGLRKGAISQAEIHQYADKIELDASILQCFEICDELHTMTSQSGFEALIRGIPVHCYGLPFYAGWGLTHDLHLCSRRTQQIDLETLVYVTLVEYASYNLAHLQKAKIPLVRPEDVIQHIKQQLDEPLQQPSSIHPFVLKILKVFKNRVQK